MTSLHFSTTCSNLTSLDQRSSIFANAQESTDVSLPASRLFHILYRAINHYGPGPFPHPTKKQLNYLARKQFVDLQSELTSYVEDHPGYTSDLSVIVEALFCYHLIALYVSKQLDFKQLLNKWTQQLAEGTSVNDIIKETRQSNPDLPRLFIDYSYERLEIALDQFIPPEMTRFKTNCADILKELSKKPTPSSDQTSTQNQSESFHFGSFFDLSVF